MSKYILFLLICGLVVSAGRLNAQSVLHTKWRTYYLPITDTITVTFGADSMAVMTSTGAALLQSTFKVADNVLTLQDYAGENMCADLAGKYQLRINADTLILVMVQDPCDARGGTLMAKRWIRIAAPPSAAPGVPVGAKKKKRG